MSTIAVDACAKWMKPLEDLQILVQAAVLMFEGPMSLFKCFHTAHQGASNHLVH